MCIRDRYNLGLLYASGKGVPQSDELAVHWYGKAAENDLPNAQNNLGTAYYTGKGIHQDYQ